MDTKPTKSLLNYIKQKLKKNPRSHVLNLIRNGDICAEIGVWKGSFSQQLLRKKPKKLHLIDPWLYLPQFGDRCYGARGDNSQKKWTVFTKMFKTVSRTIPGLKFTGMTQNRPQISFLTGISTSFILTAIIVMTLLKMTLIFIVPN
jgi:hypothetical protein